ncbi:hypothetical protein DFAR_400010 [Desulfarculales bacterium]
MSTFLCLTFLFYPDQVQSLSVLASRLGKQRVETRTILNVLLHPEGRRGWRNHSAVLTWRGYEEILRLYYDLCLERS